jgi:hypothetical protein
MSDIRASAFIAPAVRAAGAGLGALLAGPLGGTLGQWLGGALGLKASLIVDEYVKEFGEKAAEKLLETGADSLGERLKESSPRIEDVYRQALRLSLQYVHSQIPGEDFDDWFRNWEHALAARVILDLSPIEPGQLVPDKLDSLFRRTLESIDAQGESMRRKSVSITPRFRAMPDELSAELTRELPGRFKSSFGALIVTPEYEQAWKQTQLVFQQFAGITLRRIGETTERIDLNTELLPHIAEATGAIREQIADLKIYITKQIASQASQKQRKTWRDLSHLSIPMLAGISQTSYSFFVSQLFTGLAHTFHERPYCQFTGVLRYADRIARGQTVPTYYLLCHQIEFCESVRRTTELQIRSYATARKNGRDAIEKLQRKSQDDTDAFNSAWDARALFDVSTQWMPLLFTVDSARKRIRIETSALSVDPLQYASGINPTSELLRFAASIVNTGDIAHLGDITWYDTNYSLLKLFVDILDYGRLEIDRIRINAEDYEEWDYVNSRVDLEIKKSGESRPAERR